MAHSQTIILDENREEKDKNNQINKIEDKSSEDSILNNFYKETKNLEESDKNLEQFIFIFFSSLTCLGIIGINAAIFKSFKKISTKSIFTPILIVYISSFILSLILYFFYSIPKIVISVKKNVHNQVEINDSSKTNDIKNENLKTDILYTKVNNKNNNYDNNLDEQFNNNNKLEETDEKTESDNPDDNQLNNKVQNYRNACTCFGYVYFSKNVNNKTVCICHKYYSCCYWFKSKIVKLEIFCPLLVEVYLQLSSVGYNSVLSDKLLEEYTTSKIVKFFLDFFLTVIFITLYIAFSKLYVLNYRAIIKKFNDNGESIYKKKRSFVLLFTILFFAYFLVINIYFFIISILYISNNEHSGEKWQKRFEGSAISLKCLDLHMICFFDFFDDEDCLNTSLFITVEKLIWMIIEVIFDIFEIKNKNLFIIQLSVSGVFFIIAIFVVIFFIRDIRNFCKK